MALVVADLEAELLAALTPGTPPSAAAAATNWADAYRAYAQPAQAGAVPLTLPDAASYAALVAGLVVAFDVEVPGGAAGAAAAMAAALAAYWMAALFAGMTVPPNVAGLVSSLVPQLTAIFATGSPLGAAVAAQEIAAAMDTATRAVVVTFPMGATAMLS